jgi:hypothetical protein
MSIRQARRNRDFASLNYFATLCAFVKKISENGKWAVVCFDDDYTEGWYRKFIQQSAEEMKDMMKKLTVITIDILPQVPCVETNMPFRLDPGDTRIRIPTLETYFKSHLDYRNGYLNWFLKLFGQHCGLVGRELDPIILTITQMRKSNEIYKYGSMSGKSITHTQGNAKPVAIEDHAFGSYQEIGMSLLTPLLVPQVWDQLGKGVVVSVGDYPKASMGNTLIDQIAFGEEHFLKLWMAMGNYNLIIF